MSKELQFILPLCSKTGNYLDELSQEFLELLNDHDSFVKNEALETFSCIIPVFTDQILSETILPAIKAQYDDNNEECL